MSSSATIFSSVFTVVVRINPFTDAEKSDGAVSVLHMPHKDEEEGPAELSVVNPNDSKDEKIFPFDFCFNSHDLLSDEPKIIFEKVGRPCLPFLVGSEKEQTHLTFFGYGENVMDTFFGSASGGSDGLVPRVMKEVFPVAENNKVGVSLQSFQIDMEQVWDLLQDKRGWPANGMKLRTGRYGVFADVNIEACKNVEELMASVNKARVNATSPTAHVVFRITLEKPNEDEIRFTVVCLGSLNDPKSSAKAKGTCTMSLASLGNAAKAMMAKKRPAFRNTKLTLLLQTELTKGKMFFFAAVSAASSSFDVTLANLRYATRFTSFSIKEAATTAAAKAEHVGENGGEECPIEVGFRIRPFNQKEKSLGATRIIRMTDEGGIAKVFVTSATSSEENMYPVDFCFNSFVDDPEVGPYATQETVFEKMGAPALEHLLRGVNVTIFSCGEMMSGKTYTLFGTGENPGLVPRIMENVFKAIDPKTTAITISAVEIYLEVINNLLGDRNSGLKVKMTGPDCFVLEAATEVQCSSFEEMAQLAASAESNRTKNGSPLVSRGHIIYQFSILQQVGEGKTAACKLCVVDLAGPQSPGFSNLFTDEGKAINGSLNSLSTALKALKSGSKPSYRQSKLTTMLSAMLPAAKVYVVAAASPSEKRRRLTRLTLSMVILFRSVKTRKEVVEDWSPIEPSATADDGQHSENSRSSVSTEYRVGPDLPAASAQPPNSGGSALVTTRSDAIFALPPGDGADKLQHGRLQRQGSGAFSAPTLLVVPGSSPVAMPALPAMPSQAPQAAQPVPRAVLQLVSSPGSSASFSLSSSKMNVIGSGTKADATADINFIQICGPGMIKEHCRVEFDETSNKVTLTPCSPAAHCRVNGRPTVDAAPLRHNDLVWLGERTVFVLQLPNPDDKGRKFGVDANLLELAEKDVAEWDLLLSSDRGLALSMQLKKPAKIAETANVIVRDLGVDLSFYPIMAQRDPQLEEQSLMMVVVGPQLELLWTWEKMQKRFAAMIELWEQWHSSQKENGVGEGQFRFPIDDTKNPFIDEDDQLLGVSLVLMAPIGNMMSQAVKTKVVTPTGVVRGTLYVELSPLDCEGKEGPWKDDREELDPFVGGAEELKGELIEFKVKVIKMTFAEQLENVVQFSEIFVKYTFNGECVATNAVELSDGEAHFKHEHLFRIQVPLNELDPLFQLIRNGNSCFEVWGKVVDNHNSFNRCGVPAGWKMGYLDPSGEFHGFRGQREVTTAFH